MSQVNLYQEIVHAEFAPNRNIVDSIGMASIWTVSPARYKKMTLGRQRNERALFWFTFLFSGLLLFVLLFALVAVIVYDPAKLFPAGVVMISLATFVLYRFAIAQGFLRWMYKNKT